MIRKYRRISGAVAMVTLAALVLTGCTSEASNIGRAKEKNGEVDVVDTGFTLSTVGSFDSADTAVVLATDLDNKAVSLINMDTGKQYTLYYDGTTYVKDKYDGPMSISQIKAGDVVDVTFLKGKKKLASIKRSPEAWVLDDVYNYDLAGANKTASIGSQIYSLPDSAVVLSEGRRVEAGEVVSQDVVTISGIDHKIYSVNVDKGHGYLRLKNDQPLLGGWIEVGNSVIRQIREDMLLTVPEGSYQVVLSNNNVGCVKDITVERDKEVVLDVSDLEVAEDAVGKILFTVEPEDAKVSVDGKPVDISKAVELKYGIHQIQAEANGYDTLTRHIQVGSEYATISFKLEESRKNDSANSVSSNTTTPDQIPWEDTLETSRENKPSVSDNTTSSLSENALGTSSNYKVYVDSPKGVEVYLDGNYVGLSPVRFTKTVGRHEITLKKSGYKTKTYTIYLENTKKDETYSFSALEKESSGSNNGGNNNDDNSGGGSTVPAPLPTGKVSFSVTPADAEITTATIGDKTIDFDKEMEFDYGTYTVHIKATVKDEKYHYDGDITIDDDFIKGLKDGKYSFELMKDKEESNPEIEVKPDTVTVEKGNTTDFEAHVKVNGEEIKDAGVKWDVSGKKSDSTGFLTDGKPSTLTVASDESAETLTVTATYTDSETNQTSSGTATVTVAGKDITVEVTADPAEITGNGSVTFTAVVKEGDEEKKDASVKWTTAWNPTEAAKSTVDTAGTTMKLSVDSVETDTSFTATATYVDGGTEKSASQTVNIKKRENPDKPKLEIGGNEDGNVDIPETEDGEGKENGDEDDTSDGLTTETITITQESHPIRKWFSSLFKK